MELNAGDDLEGFRLVRMLGRGGMAVVWEAVRTNVAGSAERRVEGVALKILHERSAADPKLQARLVREVRAASAVQHPAIVPVLDVIERDGALIAIALELLHGETLDKRLQRQQRLDVETTARLIAPVVSAVGTAHATGVVHRDLKPSNVFLQRDGRSRVLDFGLAKLITGPLFAGLEQLTTHTSPLGTPLYMAPEQIVTPTEVDARVDVWSLGILLYEVLSGIVPTQAPTFGQLVRRITTQPIWPLRDAAPDVPADLAQMVDSMVERVPAQRCADLRGLAALLAEIGQQPPPSFGPPAAPS